MKAIHILFSITVSMVLFSCQRDCEMPPIELNNSTPPCTTIPWNKTYGGTNDDMTFAAVNARDGGYIAAGFSFSNDGDVPSNSGGTDAYVIKVNAQGEKVWQKSFGTKDDERATSIVAAPDGGYVILVEKIYASFALPGADVVIIKIDESGNKIWETVWGASSEYNDDDFPEYIKAINGGYIFAARSNQIDINKYDTWLVKLDLNGNVLSERSYQVGLTNSILPLDNGEFIIAGKKEIEASNNDAWVAKIDMNGNQVWQKTFGGSTYDAFYEVIKGLDGGYILVGGTASNDGDMVGNHGGGDLLIMKIDESGNKLWQRLLGGNSDEGARSILSDNGNYIIAGISYGAGGDVVEGKGDADAWILKVTTSGNIVEQKVLGGSGQDLTYGFTLLKASDCGYVVISSSNSNDGDLANTNLKGGVDIWASKFNFQ